MSTYDDKATPGDALRTDTDQPNIGAMKAELQHACTNATNVIEQMLLADNTVYCRWEHQQDDGRLPDTVDGREAEPWPRASDVRVRLADELVNDQVKMMKAAARRATFTLKATKGASFEAAGKVRSYLNWLRTTRMRRNVRRETKLAAWWRQVYGKAAMAVTWHQEWAREYQTVTVPQLQQAAAQQPGGVAAQILAGLFEPDADVKRALAGILRQMYPDLDQGEALKQLNALARTGTMELPARYLRRNEPRWKALKWWVDVFGPLNLGDLQEAPWIARRMVLTKAQVQEKQISEGWSEEFVEAVVAQAGKSALDWLNTATSDVRQRKVFQDSAELMTGLCEVFYFYYTHADEAGVPSVHLTVMSPHGCVDEAGEPLFGLDQAYGYEHGDLPFVLHQREITEEQTHESRGTPEAVMTQQTEAKAMRDARVNQTELFLQPPVIRPEREVGLSLTIRPRGEIGERRAQATRQWSVPNTAPAGEPLENDARNDAYRYFARNRAEDPVRAGLYDQDLADDWCEELEECWAQTLKLAQQFEDEVRFDRIVGGQAVNVRLTRQDLQGEYDFGFFFNTDSLNPERMEQKANLAAQVIAPLAGGVVDFGPIARGMAAYFFPEFAEDALREGPQAAQAEVKDEQENWSKMMAGTEPEMAESGQNFQLRLQWLEQQLAQPGSSKRLAQNEDSAALVEKRMQHLRFQVQQMTVNAQTGRVGAQAGPTAA
jgi:hypothetical protein